MGRLCRIATLLATFRTTAGAIFVLCERLGRVLFHSKGSQEICPFRNYQKI